MDLCAFRNTNGAQLLHMSMEDFCRLVGHVYGPLFHDELQEFQRRQRKECDGDDGSSMSYCGLDDALHLTSEDIKDLDRYIVGGLQDIALENNVSLQYGECFRLLGEDLLILGELRLVYPNPT